MILNLVTHRIAHRFLCAIYSRQVSAQFYSHSSQNITPSRNIPTCEVFFPSAERKKKKKKYSESLSSLIHPQYNFWLYATTHSHHNPVKTPTYPVGTEYVHTGKYKLKGQIWDEKTTSLLTFQIKKIKMKSFANSTK